MSNLILADGLVEGTIQGGGTEASVTAEVSCVNSTPSGNISGSIEFFDGRATRRVTFSSSDAVIVITRNTDSLQSVGAEFADVQVRDLTGGTTTRDCTAFLTATRLGSDSWVGSFEIVCPNGKTFFIFGVFDGETIVNRQVFCRPLL